MNIVEILEKALENKLISEEVFKDVKKNIGELLPQDKVNEIVKGRLKDEKEKYEEQIANLQQQKDNKEGEVETKVEEYEAKITQLTEELEGLNTKLEEKDSVIKERIINEMIDSKLNSLELPRELPKTYKELIKKTDNEEELIVSIEEIVGRYKEENPTIFGGGANPGDVEKDFSKMTTDELFQLSLKSRK